MPWYNAGTVAVTNNNAAVTGTGTAWADNIDAGQAFVGPDGLAYEILSVVSATQITLASNYKGATAGGQSYRIMPVQGYLRDLAVQAASLVLSFATVRDNAGNGIFGSGSVTTPGVRFSGDEDTGIYRPGTNLLSISTNGTERMRFESGGGVRLVTPAATTEATLSLDPGGIGFNSRDNQIRGGNNGSNQTYIDFYTSNAAAPARAVRINEVGNVGIGTVSISFKLDVSGSNDVARLTSSSTTAGLLMTDSVGTVRFGTRSGAAIFDVGGVERARIDSSGNMGIGQSPAYKLDVNGGIRTQGWGSAVQGNIMFGSGAAASIFGDASIMAFSAGGVEKARLTGTGLGIGASSLGPAAPLDITTAAGRVFVSAASGNNAISSVNSGNSAFVDLRLDGNNVILAGGGVQRWYVTSGGHFYAWNDNAYSLGGSGNRASVVYAATGTINTSDAREKEWRGGLSAAELEASRRIAKEIGIYQWLDAITEKGPDGARLHCGVRAQQTFQIMEDCGLDWRRYAWACYDQWEDEREAVLALVAKTRMVERIEPRTRMVEREVPMTCMVEEERTNYRPVNPDDPDSLYESFTETVQVERTYFKMAEVEESYLETVEFAMEYEELEDTGETRVLRQAGDRFGIRPDQLAFWLIAGQEQRLAALEAA